MKQYEDTMQNVLPIMNNLGAGNYHWSKSAAEQGTVFYTESFTLPTESHYFAMKEFRGSAVNHTFLELSQYIDTDRGAVQYIGLQITS